MNLVKRLNYDVNYDKADSDVKNRIYNQQLTFDSLEGTTVICKGWSELFKQLLIDAGVDESRIIIPDGHIHKWIEIDMGDQILCCDATDNVLFMSDINAVKIGNSINGFILIPKKYVGERLTSIHLKSEFVDILNSQRTYWKKIDKKIGYIKGNKYFDSNEKELIKEFYDPSISERLFGYDKKRLLLSKIDFIKNIEIPENMNVLDVYRYFETLTHVLFSNLPRELIRELKFTGPYVKFFNAFDSEQNLSIITTYFSIIIDKKIYCKFFDDIHGSYDIVFDNESDFENYIISLKKKG